MLSAPVLMFAMPGAVWAQDSLPSPSLPSDYKADLGETGIQVGSFTISPSLSLGQGATDNLYQTADKTASAISTLAPKLKVASEWSRHSLQFTGDAALNRYIGNSARNQDTWSLAPSGTLDIDKRFSLQANANFSQLALNRYSDELVGGFVSVAIVRQEISGATLNYQFGRLQASAAAQHSSLSYQSVILFDGTRQDQSALDHTVDTLTARASYKLSPDFSLFAQVNWSHFDFAPSASPTSSNASSTGVRITGGAQITVRGLGRATLSTGYSRRDYEPVGIRTVKGASAVALLEFYPSTLTTVSFQFGHRLDEARLLNSNANKVDFVRTQVDHAILRNLLLSLNTSFTKNKSAQTAQDTEISSLSFTAQYLANRYFDLKGAISYSSRKSTPQTARGNSNELLGGLTATFKL
jgi:hypothetical protein